LKALVAIKLTYDVNQLKFEKDGTPILDACPKVMGEADKCAVEEAVRFKEKTGAEVTAVTIGSSKEHYRIIRDAYAMGVDKGVIVKVENPDLIDALTVAKVIAALNNKLGPFDVIFLGSGASDTHSSVVGPMVASLLNYKLLANADKVGFSDGKFTVVSTLEDGQYTSIAEPPVVITVTSEANQPRIPTIKDILRSKRKPIDEVSLEDLGIKPRILSLENLTKHEVKRKRIKIDATENVEEAVEKLIKALEEEGVI
jgi:electron transfer flavoprotein beta subunit